MRGAGGYSVVYLTDRFYFFKFIFSWLFLGYIRSLNNLQQIFGCINRFKNLFTSYLALKYMYVNFTWILMVEQHWSAIKSFGRWHAGKLLLKSPALLHCVLSVNSLFLKLFSSQPKTVILFIFVYNVKSVRERFYVNICNDLQ